jgi:hypothetical protein
LIHFQAGQETKKTIAVRPRIALNIMNRRVTVYSSSTMRRKPARGFMVPREHDAPAANQQTFAQRMT